MVTSGFFRGARFQPESSIPDLSGQVYIVTGASAGIGFGIAAQLLQRNASKIIILSSGEERGKKAIQDLQAYGDSSRARFVKCNLSDLKDSDHVAKSLRDSEPRIDGLILNAGIGVAEYSLSADGIDNHSQINWLSQLHLALMLMPVLKKTRDITGVPSRMVLMSSEMHRFAPKSTEFASLDELNTDVGATQLYARSKLAQILLVRELVRRMGSGEFGFDNKDTDSSQAVLVNATHPGGVKTPQQEALKGAYGSFWYKIVDAVVRPFMVDPVAVGCRSGLFAATTNKEFMEQHLHGKYIVPDKKVMEPTKQAQDEEMAERLWNLSIYLLKDRLGKLDYEFKI